MKYLNWVNSENPGSETTNNQVELEFERATSTNKEKRLLNNTNPESIIRDFKNYIKSYFKNSIKSCGFDKYVIRSS